jgi:RNA polymerase sigma-70 factor, ECF subfamily
MMGYITGMERAAIRKRSHPEDPDWVLLQGIAAGDQDALGDLYQRQGPSLLAYLVSRLGDVRLAEEVLQDVILAAWRAAPTFRRECRVKTWLLSIARTRSINAYHRQVAPSARESSLDELSLATPGEAPGQYADLHAAIRTLPDEQREALELVFYHGLSLAETSLLLEVPIGTVKSRMHRAKTNLRKWIDPENEFNERSHR